MLTDDASYWKLIKLRFSDSELRQPQQSLPAIKRDLKKPVNSDKPLITWFGHSTLFLQINQKNILVDPVFSERASPFQFLGPKNFSGTGIYSAGDFPEIDFLLITHDHYDHLDKAVMEKIHTKTARFIVPLGVAAHLVKWGIPAEKITELDWWDEQKLTSEIKIAATPARHFSGRGLTRNKTLWTSYVLVAGEHKIYFGADSGYGPHFKEIGEKYGPFDITFLESGQYHNYWKYIHMLPEETVQAHHDLNGKVLMPIHWGKFELALHAWTEPITRVLQEAEKTNAVIATPLIGEPMHIGGEIPQQKWWLNMAK